MKSLTAPLIVLAGLFAAPIPAAAQLSSSWIVPAAANTAGERGTYWRTDLSIHNPQGWELPIVVQVLESGRVNDVAPTLDLVVQPYETVNLWDVLGPDLFAIDGTGAILVYVPPEESCPGDECRFLTTSRTYTLDPEGGFGEFGQALPAAGLLEGTDWSSYGYAAGILNDGTDFRCNVGVASWTGAWTTVAVDVQDSDGTIVDTQVFDVPPFGHLQRRLQAPVVGGSLVFYLVSGPSDTFVYPYASVVNQTTGDPSYFFARYSGVGVPAKSARATAPHYPRRGRSVDWEGAGNRR